MAIRMVSAPRYLPSTICQGARGSVSKSSAVPPLYSAASRRIEMSGASVTSRMPMFWNVPAIVVSPVRKML
jgi:hypothetical protein